MFRTKGRKHTFLALERLPESTPTVFAPTPAKHISRVRFEWTEERTLSCSSMCMNARRSLASFPVDLRKVSSQRSCLALESQWRRDKTYLYSSGSSLPPAPSFAFFDTPASRTSCSGLCLPFISTVDVVGMLDVIVEG